MSTLKAAKTALRDEITKVLKELDSVEKKRQSESVLKKVKNNSNICQHIYIHQFKSSIT